MHRKQRPPRGNTEVAKNLEKLWNREDEISGEKVSLTTLAGRIGIAQSILYRIYTGESVDPKDRTIIPIAEYFDVTVPQLRGYAPVKGSQTSAKARLLARKIDALPPRTQKVLYDLVEELLSQSSRKVG